MTLQTYRFNLHELFLDLYGKIVRKGPTPKWNDHYEADENNHNSNHDRYYYGSGGGGGGGYTTVEQKILNMESGNLILYGNNPWQCYLKVMRDRLSQMQLSRSIVIVCVPSATPFNEHFKEHLVNRLCDTTHGSSGSSGSGDQQHQRQRDMRRSICFYDQNTAVDNPRQFTVDSNVSIIVCNMHGQLPSVMHRAVHYVLVPDGESILESHLWYIRNHYASCKRLVLVGQLDDDDDSDDDDGGGSASRKSSAGRKENFFTTCINSRTSRNAFEDKTINID